MEFETLFVVRCHDIPHQGTDDNDHDDDGAPTRRATRLGIFFFVLFHKAIWILKINDAKKKKEEKRRKGR